MPKWMRLAMMAPPIEGGGPAEGGAPASGGAPPAPPAQPASGVPAETKPSPGGAPPAAQGGAGATLPEGDKQPSIFELLNVEPPRPQGKKPAGEPAQPGSAAPAVTETPEYRELLQKHNALVEERAREARAKGDEHIFGEIAKTMGMEGASPEELRQEFGPQVAAGRVILGEILKGTLDPVLARLERIEATQGKIGQVVDQTSFEAGRPHVEAKVKEIAKALDVNLERFMAPVNDPETGQALGSQLDQMVGLFMRDSLGLTIDAEGNWSGSGTKWDTAAGYLEVVEILATKIKAAEARQRQSAEARKQDAETRKQPGGRSPKTPVAKLSGQPAAVRRKALGFSNP